MTSFHAMHPGLGHPQHRGDGGRRSNIPVCAPDHRWTDLRTISAKTIDWLRGD